MNKKELDNYRVAAAPAADGKGLKRTREYIGPTYTLLLDAAAQRRLLAAYAAVSAGVFALHTALAFWEIPSNAEGYVGGPSLMALVPLLFVITGVLGGFTVKNGGRMEQGKFRETSLYRRYGALCAALFLLWSLIGGLAFTVLHRADVPVGKELAVCAEYLLSLLACLWIWRTERNLRYDRTPGENEDGGAHAETK